MTTAEHEAADRFRKCLITLAELTRLPSPSATSELSREFRDSLMQFGSISEDNQRCAENLELGTIAGYGRASFGVRVRDLPYSAASLLWHAEGCPIPAQLSEALPEVSQAQWDACLRLATLVLLVFESPVSDSMD